MNLYDLNTGDEMVDVNSTSTIIKKITDTISSREKTVNIPTKSLNINGIAVADSFDKYLNNEYLSSGQFKEALKSPLHYDFSVKNKSENERIKGKKDYFELGTFIHQCILEPTKFKRAIVEPSYSLSSHEGVDKGIKFWSEKLKEKCLENGKKHYLVLQKIKNETIDKYGDISKKDVKVKYLNKIISYTNIVVVSEENFFKIQQIKQNIDNYSNGVIYKLFKHSKREISFYAEIDGLKLRVRPDAIQFEENIGINAILSVKSSAVDDLGAFYKQASKMNYDLSEYMYQKVISEVSGRDFSHTITLFIQSVAPFGVALLIWNNEDINMGKNKFEMAKETVLNYKAGIFKDIGFEVYSEPENMGIIEMDLPKYYKN